MRPQSHVTGDVGQKAVSFMLADWGWTADLIASDYGEDLDCHVFVDEQRTPLHFRCQVKSTLDASAVRRLKSGDFSVQIAAETCRDWLLAYYPVFIVVYDRKKNAAYWANAKAQISEKLASLSKKSLNLRVTTKRILTLDEKEILSELTSFYTGLLKTDDGTVERTVFPVLMPRYRALPLHQALGLFSKGEMRQATRVSRHRNSLPAWTTVLQTLDSQYLHGKSFQVPSADLTRFNTRLTAALAKLEFPVRDDEWLAFVCEPISFGVGGQSASGSFSRELTGWGSFACVDGQIVPDHEYAFSCPPSFIAQIGRRSRSIEGYYCVSPEHDVAMRVVAGTATTPADQLQGLILRQHTLAQFMAWECPEESVDELRELLVQADLSFATLASGLYAGEGQGLIYGAISTPLFNPDHGLIPQARNWEELEFGTVRSRLDRAGLIGKIPGKEGPASLDSTLKRMVSHMVTDTPTSWLVDFTKAERGMPVDLSDRRVSILRIRAKDTTDMESAVESLSQAIAGAGIGMSHPSSIWVSHFVLGDYDDFVGIMISWRPALTESSCDAVQVMIAAVLPLLHVVFPSCTGTGAIDNTLDALRYAGEIYFQGDKMYQD